MRRRTRAADPGLAVRLESADPDDWLSPAERVRLVELVDYERALPAPAPGNARARTTLDRVAPVAGLAARMSSDRESAVQLVEKVVVDHRRRAAGAQLAATTKQPREQVASRYKLGHLGPADPDGPMCWLAAEDISQVPLGRYPDPAS